MHWAVIHAQRPWSIGYTWGEQNERWLDAINWQGENVRVGNPFVQKYLKMRESCKPKELPKNILVLQYTPQNTDIRGLNANQYGFFVDIVRRLKAIGDFNIRLKLHPGVWKKSYYEKIKAQYSLGCEIRDDGPFEKHLGWADIVIYSSIKSLFGGPICQQALLSSYYAASVKNGACQTYKILRRS